MAVASNAVASAPGLPRTGVQRTAGIVAVTVVVLLGWGLATTGPLGAERLAGSLADPVVILLPPMLAFLLALAFLAVLPPVLRALSRRLQRHRCRFGCPCCPSPASRAVQPQP